MWKALPILVLACATGASAFAATRTVQSGETIQSVIDQSAPGDVVKVPAGVWLENLVIDATKTGLVLRGVGPRGGVVIDARPLAPTGSGPGIRILAPNVHIENLTVRHARSTSSLPGTGIDVAADGIELLDVDVTRSQSDAIAVVGAGFSATGCNLVGNTRAATITGAGARFTRCEIARCGDRGISITGDDAVIDHSRVTSVEDGEGIVVVGARVTIHRCYVLRTALDGIKITGDGAVVDRNEVHCTIEKGIRVSGSAFLVTGNDVSKILKGGDGIRVQNATSGEVTDNNVEWCLENGIEVTGSTGVSIRNNHVSECASEKEPSIQISSSSITVDGNVVVDGQGDGIRVAGDDNVVSGNRIRRCLEDGIDVNSGNGNTVDGNIIKDCHAEGLENNGSLTFSSNNVCAGNRLDYANSGTFATDVSNTFDTGGESSAPQIDD